MRTPWMLALMLACATPALAQAADPTQPPAQAEDGQGVDKKHPRFAQGAVFERIDATGDGFIDADEWAAAVEQMIQRDGKDGDGTKLFAFADADGDGRISRAEWDEGKARLEAMREGKKPEPGAMAERAFTRMDTNGDGALSLDEFKAGMEEMRNRHGDKGERGERPSRPRPLP